MKRQIALIAFAVGSLTRRWPKNGAVAAALALVVALFSSTLFMTDSLRREYELFADDMPDLTVQRLIAGRPALIPVETAERLRDIPTVRSVRPRVWGYHFFSALEGNVTIVGTTSDHRFDGAVETGRWPRTGNEVAVGRSLIDLLGLRVGDELGIPIRGEVLFSDVVGTFSADSALRSADVVVTTEDNARRLLGVPAGSATDLVIDLTTEDEASVVTERIGERIVDARVLDRRLLRRTYELTFDARAGVLSAWLVPALIAFLLLAWDRLSGIGATERREIGVLKAIGWSTPDVLAARLWESFLIGFVGIGLGIVFAYVYVFAFGAPGMLDALLGWSALYPGGFTLRPALDISQLFAIVAATLVPFVALSTVPAWRAAQLDPDRALRGDAG